jgi:hypothetical protein
VATLTIQVSKEEFDRVARGLTHPRAVEMIVPLERVVVVHGNDAQVVEPVLIESLGLDVKQQLGMALDCPTIRAYVREEEADAEDD